MGEEDLSQDIAVRCWLGLQLSEGLRLRDLLPRWITRVVGKLVPLHGTLWCFHDMTRS